MTIENPQEMVPVLLERLTGKYPDARYELDWTTPLEMLVATILAAQCTDVRVNKVTKTLFKKYTSAQDYVDAKTSELEEDIKSTGTYKQKAKAIQGACKVIVEKFQGNIPQTMAELQTLPGVARKTANVVLNTVWNIPSGIIVDTHVHRVSQRMGLSKNKKPDIIEKDLMQIVPKDRWTFFGPAMVLHGRYTCVARSPQCRACMFNDVCPKLNLEGGDSSEDAEEAAPAKPAPTPAPQVGSKNVIRDPVQQQVAIDFSESKTSHSASMIPSSWQTSLGPELNKPYFTELMKFLEQERASKEIFPPESEVFSALELTPYENVNVLLLGQDPYHDNGQAHGLCFSVKPGIKTPPSLVNMYKELKTDLGCKIPNNGYLIPWAKQGMLMINAVLTVQAHTPNSHKDRGWEQFTDAIIRKVNERPHVVFLLWGSYAQKKSKLIDAKKHTLINCAHPSPLSASKFFGSKPFSKTNEALRAHGQPEIDWQIPDL